MIRLLRLLLLCSLCYARDGQFAPEDRLARLDKTQWQQWLATCGLSIPIRNNPNNENRIGTWMFRVENGDTGFICGAVLITSVHLLTLTRCFRDGDMELITSLGITTAYHHAFVPIDDGGYRPQYSEHSIIHYVTPIVYSSEAKRVAGPITIAQLSEGENMQLVSTICVPLPSVAFPSHHIFATVEHPVEHPVEQLRTFDVEFLHNVNDCEEDACFPMMSHKISQSDNDQKGNPLYFVMHPGRETVFGLMKNETHSFSIPYWSDFICRQTGACIRGFYKTDYTHENIDYFFDGSPREYDISEQGYFAECSQSKMLTLMRTLTPLRRIKQSQNAAINEFICGRPQNPASTSSSFLTNSFAVGIFITNKFRRRAWQITHQVFHFHCGGTLISSSHILSSFSCIKNYTKTADIYAVFSPKQDDTENMQSKGEFPYANYEFNYYYDSASVGKRYIAIHNMIAPHCDEAACKDIDLVILELYRPIDISQSYIHPVCLPSSSDTLPDHLMALVDEETKKDELVHRTVVVRNVTVSGGTQDKTIVVEGPLLESVSYFGAPLVSFDGKGRAIMHGIIVNTREIDGQTRNVAVKMQSVTSFVCIHAGICPDGYDNYKEEELYSPFFSNEEGAVEFALESMNSKAFSDKFFSDPMVMERELRRLGNLKDRVNLRMLSEEENIQNNEECGKIFAPSRMNYGTTIKVADHPWPVVIETIVLVFEPRGEARSKYVWQIVCTGSFISRRHVITAAHCINTNTYNKPNDLRVSYGSPCYNDCDDSAPLHAYIRHVVYSVSGFRDFIERVKRERDRLVIDIAILELTEDIAPSARNGILCIPRNIDDDLENNRLTVYGAGKAMEEMIPREAGTMQNFTMDITKEGNVIMDRNYMQVTWHDFAIARPSNDFGDSGGPLVRYRNDGRAMLFGVASSVRKNHAIPSTFAVQTNLIVRAFVCRVTGVCAEDKKELLKEEIPKPMINGIEVCAKFD